jgi:hypothetical protein
MRNPKDGALQETVAPRQSRSDPRSRSRTLEDLFGRRRDLEGVDYTTNLSSASTQLTAPTAGGFGFAA